MNPSELKRSLLKRFEEEVEKQKDSISSGSADSLSQYKQMCGYLNGIEFAIRAFEDVWGKYVKDDERY